MGAPKLPVLAVAAALTLAACGGSPEPAARTAEGRGSSTASPASTSVAISVATSAPSAVTPRGYERIAARVTAADGEVCDLCVWLADTAERRSRGLIGVTDLGRAEAMAFRYPAPETGSFWMKDTLLPLSIAFYDGDGAFVDSFDMEPCVTDPCPSYPTPAGFTVAVEVPRGGLDELLMEPGSTLALLDLPCA